MSLRQQTIPLRPREISGPYEVGGIFVPQDFAYELVSMSGRFTPVGAGGNKAWMRVELLNGDGATILEVDSPTVTTEGIAIRFNFFVGAVAMFSLDGITSYGRGQQCPFPSQCSVNPDMLLRAMYLTETAEAVGEPEPIYLTFRHPWT